jgi:hypothetical protein
MARDKKLVYSAPIAVPLGEIAVAAGSACRSGMSPKANCSSGTGATGGSCTSGGSALTSVCNIGNIAGTSCGGGNGPNQK